jgi:hypothetical protein
MTTDGAMDGSARRIWGDCWMIMDFGDIKVVVDTGYIDALLVGIWVSVLILRSFLASPRFT